MPSYLIDSCKLVGENENIITKVPPCKTKQRQTLRALLEA